MRDGGRGDWRYDQLWGDGYGGHSRNGGGCHLAAAFRSGAGEAGNSHWRHFANGSGM